MVPLSAKKEGDRWIVRSICHPLKDLYVVYLKSQTYKPAIFSAAGKAYVSAFRWGSPRSKADRNHCP